MVEVKAVSLDIAKEFCENIGLEYKDGTSVLQAIEGEKILGSCVYDVNEGVMTLRVISPQEDFIMADSLLRSALFVAANKGIFDVYWSKNIKAELILKLGFVKNITNCSIDITNLFSSCENCKKDK